MTTCAELGRPLFKRPSLRQVLNKFKLVAKMLEISLAAMEAFSAVAVRSFTDRMIRHLREFFPDECAAADDSDLRAFISSSLRQARAFDIVAEREVAEFADLLIALNPVFSTDLDMPPWAVEILARRDWDAKTRLDNIYDETIGTNGLRTL
jgi:hypothetical protein